jgi:hypothetical protein
MRTLFWMLSLRKPDSVEVSNEETFLAEKVDPTEMKESDTSDTVAACMVIDNGPIEPRKFKCRVKTMRKKAVTAMKKLFSSKLVIENVNGFYEIRRERKGNIILKVCYSILIAFGAVIIVGLGVFCALALSGAFVF